MRLIDADKAYSILTDYYHHKTDTQHQALIEALNRVPTIYPPMGYKVLADGRGWAYFGKEEVDPIRHGQWIPDTNDKWVCSECGMGNMYAYSWDIAGYKLQDCYCPFCGAKMEGE